MEIFLTCIILFIINHFYLYVTRLDNELNMLSSEIEKIKSKELKIANFDGNNKEMYNQQFKNYYILGSMNSCCTGGIVDGKLNMEALKNTIALGPRFLDFEIYQKNGKPVIAAGEEGNNQKWSTENYLSFEYVMGEVKKYALGGSRYSPNYADPLILSFRIKTSQNKIYSTMADALKNTFGAKLLDKSSYKNSEGSLAKIPLNDLKHKVIIYCHDNNNGKGYKDTTFENLVNMSNNQNINSITYNEKIHSVAGVKTADLDYNNLKIDSKKRVCVVFSHNQDLSNYTTNKKAHRKVGAQISPINFSGINSDVNLSSAKEHWDFFNKQKSAFVLKPEHLIHKDIVIPSHKITKQTDDVSYATRKVTAGGHEFKF